MLRYAGIGSRETPLHVCKYIRTNLAPKLCKEGWKLLSGGAVGADQAFMENVPPDKREIYVTRRLPGLVDPSIIYAPRLKNWDRALETVEKFHPNPYALKKRGARELIARNSYQVLGSSLKDPVDMIVCWTLNGEIRGGTGQALRIAEHYKIPVYNLGLKGLDLTTIGKKELERYLEDGST